MMLERLPEGTWTKKEREFMQFYEDLKQLKKGDSPKEPS